MARIGTNRGTWRRRLSAISNRQHTPERLAPKVKALAIVAEPAGRWGLRRWRELGSLVPCGPTIHFNLQQTPRLIERPANRVVPCGLFQAADFLVATIAFLLPAIFFIARISRFDLGGVIS